MTDLPLVVSELATPTPNTIVNYNATTIFRLWYNNNTVAVLTENACVILLEKNERIPSNLETYIMDFQNKNHSKFNLSKISHFQHVIKKMRKE